MKTLYLKEDVYFEPLFNKWYVWPYLIAPAQASLYIVNIHLRTMRSFVNNYQLHIMASKESTLAGGQFLNCSENQVAEVQELVKNVEENSMELIELAEAITDLEELLRGHTSGESIEYLYAKIPDLLSGYIELFMDMEHRPGYRFIESLIYKSNYYKPHLQSVSFGLLSRVVERPFVLSTPRFPDEDHLQIHIDFNSPELEQILSSRDRGISEEEVEEIIKSCVIEGGMNFRDLFSEDRPEATYTPVQNGLRLRYLGHAGFILETNTTSIIIDPVISSKSKQNKDDIISFSELPEHIDYLCITHTHQDHLNIETLLQLRHKIGKTLVPKNNGGTLADPSVRLLLQQLGFYVLEVDDLDEIIFNDGRIISIPFLGEHGDLNIRSKTAWLVEADGKRCFFGADTSCPDSKLYRRVAEMVGEVDVLAIGMECIGAPYTWIYGALYTKPVSKQIKNSRRLNGSDAVQAIEFVKAFNPKYVYVYALGLEPWYNYFMGLEFNENSEQIQQSNKFLKNCEDLSIQAERLYGKKVIHFS